MNTLKKVFLSAFFSLLIVTISYSEHTGCDDFSWNCNNPYGSCYELAAPKGGYSCMLVCAYSGAWIYCDGLGDPE